MMNNHHSLQSLLNRTDMIGTISRGRERRSSWSSTNSGVILSPCKATSQSPKRTRPGPRRSQSTTEQIIPSRRSSYNSSMTGISSSSLSREAVDENLNMRLLLLAPTSDVNVSQNHFEPGDWELEKSELDLYSHSGSVAVELTRLRGASNHHFCLYATSCQESVRVVLPAKFRGTVFTNTQDQNQSRLQCSKQLQKLIDEGFVRVNPTDGASYDEDEVHIHAGKNVEVMLEDEGVEKADMANETPVWIVQSKGRIGRLRRIFNARNR
ncbi:hypothetical protein CPB83DRAFT_845409 [Crepidotus variabilis]|uniref:DUF7330 domain-containing protein n=1 Tax=Crepidotus variabilis TaxID=179855 RepID=A0A9P6ERG3_9AGAR|nr:hypothetical protein CPB83DRAFT_845409 [Crepidotus variabilis]